MNPRTLICEALLSVFQKDAYVNETVNLMCNKYDLSDSDKAFFTKVTYGTVQHKLYLEFLLAPYLKKKPKPWLYIILLMSTYQIVEMDTPAYAAINEAVNLTKMKDFHMCGFVNATLRALTSHPLRTIDEGDRDEALALHYSMPQWLVYYLRKDYDYETVKAIFEESLKGYQEGIRVNTLKTSIRSVQESLDELGIHYVYNDHFPDGLYVDKNVIDTALFREGFITIQDLAAQRIALLSGVKEGDVVLDTCSAPGGKAAHVASLMHNTGHIYACDIYPAKIKKMEKTFSRLGVTNVSCELIDARMLSEKLQPEQIDVVLVDAPCSGLGVLSHKVDLKYHITAQDIRDIINLQSDILDHVASLVKVGGHLVYSTCTINKEENEEQIRAFLSQHPNFKLIQEESILPPMYHTDGAYVAVCVKESV